MPKRESKLSFRLESETGAEQIARLRKELGAIDVAGMFSRYRKMYKCVNVPAERIAAFTGQPEGHLLQVCTS